MNQPYALYVLGPKSVVFELSDQLGFESHMSALALSVFEAGPKALSLQALYETQSQAQAALAELDLADVSEASIAQLPDEDWVSKSQSGLPPVRAGRFWLYGAHDKDTIPNDIAHPIEVEAGLAFGTGHHGTTKGCLIIFDDLLSGGLKPNSVLDLGTGAGTLAIAAAKALELPIVATDIEQDAVDVTRENSEKNNVADLIEAVKADGFEHEALQGQQFDLIFANILAGPLMGLAPDIARALMPGGKVILSGILNEQADTVSKAFENAGLNIKAYPSIGEWTSLLGHKNLN